MVRGNVAPVFDLALHFVYAEQESNYLVVVNMTVSVMINRKIGISEHLSGTFICFGGRGL